jgi:hypothetical protein
MRPFDEIPFEESDYSDVALMLASVREWPADDFARDLDERVARRFAPEPSAAGGGRGGATGRVARGRLPRWAAGPAVALVAGVVTVIVVVSSGTLNPAPSRPNTGPVDLGARQTLQPSAGVPHASNNRASQKEQPTVLNAQHSPSSSASGSAGAATPSTTFSNSPGVINATSTAPVAPGAKQIQSAQISLTTPNEHVDEVAQEVFQVVGDEHGTVQSSHITAAARGTGGGYASFSLSIPTGNLQTTMTELSRLHFAAVQSRTDSSQNVSHQYNSDQRRLSDAQALRTSLLKQLQTAYTQTDIDSIKAQLKLAEQQITSWQNTLGSLQHRIGYSNVSVQINENGLPFVPVTRHHSSGFTIGRAGHDALHVLVVSAGVALIALAVMIPVGLVAALLMWLWVWLRQRRREHALDSAT